MTRVTEVRLIVEPRPNSGAWNMALDEALLESAVTSGPCTVRIYRWSEPTVSLGYFQKPEEISPESALAGLATVRRLSGGGAILHHHEWTYSCTLPSAHPAIRQPAELYVTVHRAIIAVLRNHGVVSSLRCDAIREPASGACQPAEAALTNETSFLCFSRGDPRDIVVQGHKIVGSAQRRRKGAVLQHGSILLQSSEYAPHLPGIVDLSPEFPNEESLGAAFGREMSAALSEHVIEATPTEKERQRATELQRTRYNRLEWTE